MEFITPESAERFFAEVLSAGAILCGFCGTFLSFRIQREAGYYRQVAIDFHSGQRTSDDLAAITANVEALLSAGDTVVLMDSGGETRTRQVCQYMGFVEDTRAETSFSDSAT